MSWGDNIKTDEAHNQSYEVKSKSVAGITQQLRRNDNLIKKSVKSILPYPIFIKLANTVVNFNKKRSKKSDLLKEERSILLKYFEPHNNSLRALTGLGTHQWNRQDE